MSKNIVVMVAAHKNYEFPKESCYLPVHVGKALNPTDLGIQGDNVGENISDMNKSFCELTGLYWLWKNNDADFVGLTHYRRYFKSISSNTVTVKGKAIASCDDLVSIMDTCDVILSNKRCYFIDTIRSHYKHSHYLSDLEQLELVMSERYPDYLEAYNKVFSGHCLSLYNMFVMSNKLFNEYSKWLFEILFELEKRISYKDYGPYQGRIFGFLSERLLNVWVEMHKNNLKVKLLPVINIEGENLLFKAFGLIKRKFLGSKLN